MKTVIKNKLYLGISAGLAMVLLSGCGGGGSGGGSGSSLSLDANDAFEEVSEAGTGESIYQSSSNAGDGVEKDSVNIEISPAVNGDLVFEATYSSPNGEFTVSVGTSSTGTYDYRFPPSGTEIATVTLGSSSVTEFTSYEIDHYEYNAEFFTNASVTGSAGSYGVDTNWLSGGVWIYYGNGTPESVEAGAFFVSGDPWEDTEVAGLRGSVTYSGVAYGYYVEWYHGNQYEGDFDGNVTLNADFDSNTIDGEITDIRYALWNNPTSYMPVTGTIELSDATFGTENFFKGETEGTVSSDGPERTFKGDWGGEFAGGEVDSKPEFVGGTFSGKCFEENGVNNGCEEGVYESAFLGIFVAEQK